MERSYARSAPGARRSTAFSGSSPADALGEGLTAWVRGLRSLDEITDGVPAAAEPPDTPAQAPEAAILRADRDRWLDEGGESGEAEAP